LEVQVLLTDRHDVPCREFMHALFKSRFPRSFSREWLLFRSGVRGRARTKIFLLLLALFCIRNSASSAQTNSSTGSVQGILLLLDSNGPAYLSGGTVVLTGQLTQQTEADGKGRYSFENVPPGPYRIEAIISGLRAERSIVVEPGKITNADLELKPAELKSTVTVTASSSDGKVSTPSETISEQTLRDAPNVNERFESALPMIPGVVRGPDGHINLKGARSTQSGALVNSANVTDPVTGSPAINLPIDVVSAVQVLSNPYDPQYGKLTGAVSSVSTKTSNYEDFHYSFQNFIPRLRDRDGTISGFEAATPRLTLTFPVVRDRLALTQSFEYRYVRTPVNSLPPSQRDNTLESFDSYTQFDFILDPKQTATVSLALYPQRLNYLGLNTFTPQPATPDFHQRGYQIYAQHRYLTGTNSLLTSQFSYKKLDGDVTAQSNDPYRLLPDTTEGGFFNLQSRRTSRFEWQEIYQFGPLHFLGIHQFKAGINFAHTSYDGRQNFRPVEIDDSSGVPVERVNFTSPTAFAINQNETSWFIADQWALVPRFTLSSGIRTDTDSVTSSTHVSPRAGFLWELTKDAKTLLKGGVGVFYDRVPLLVPTFTDFPDRIVDTLATNGAVLASTSYLNRIGGPLRNPRSTSWNLELDRQLTGALSVRLAYEQRNTADDFIVSPRGAGPAGTLLLSNSGSDSYREYQIAGRYHFRRSVLNASYVRSRAFGDLNDVNQFFGTLPQAVIQPDAKGRLAFDAPNRFLFWGDFELPWKLTVLPVYELHTGFPYSVENVLCEYVGPRNVRRFPRLDSLDLQVSRPVSLRLGHRRVKARVGAGVFNLMNHFNPRDVQNNLASAQFGEFFNSAWREYRGKFVVEY
jgi:hypothetical protein